MQEVDAVLVQEMEGLLDQVAARESDLVASYVASGGEYDRKVSVEKTQGIPGGSIIELAGPILLHFVVLIAMDVISEARKKGAEIVVTKLSEYLLSKLRKSLPAKPKHKEEMTQAIIMSLKDAGWEQSRATEAANLTWERGVAAGQQLSQLETL